MGTQLWERRHSFRIPVTGNALLREDDAVDGLYEIDDVSIDGCSLHKQQRSAPRRDAQRAWSARRGDALCDVQIALRLNGAAEIEMPARIVRRTARGALVQLGVRFTRAHPAYEDFIQDLVMDSLEQARATDDEVLVVHEHPEREGAVLRTVRSLGRRVVAARTARDAVAILERAAEHIRVALVADVVGTSRARDIAKLIVQRFPHVRCVRMTQNSARRLLGARVTG